MKTKLWCPRINGRCVLKLMSQDGQGISSDWSRRRGLSESWAEQDMAKAWSGSIDFSIKPTIWVKENGQWHSTNVTW